MKNSSSHEDSTTDFEVLDTTCRVNDLQNTNLSHWMKNLPNEKQLYPLSQLKIPGSHDSSAFWLDTSLEIAPGQPRLVHTLTNMARNATKSVVKNWSITQSWDIKQQLSGGIRYFDFRVAYRKESDDFRFVHGLYGHPVEQILNDIKSFLSLHPKEIVLLDFNSLFCMEIEEHLRLSSLLMSSFGSMLHSPNRDETIASLQDLWLAGEQVVIFYANASVLEMFPSFFGSACICSPWPNTEKKESLLKHVCDQGLASKARRQFHVTQAVLTPQVTTILKHFNGSLKNNLAFKANEAVVEWLRENMADKSFSFNVILADFVEWDDLISTIIGFNYIY